MQMSDIAILRDCLDSLKHASVSYLQASHETASNDMRQTLQRVAVDKGEQKNAVFNLMRREGMYDIRSADPQAVSQLSHKCEQLLEELGPSEAVDRERMDES